MKPSGHVIFLLILLWVGSVSTASGAEARGRIVAMPISETEEVVTPWLKENGFRIFNALEEKQQVIIEAQNQYDHWMIHLRPNSPLATKIQVSFPDGSPTTSLDRFWAYLEGYIKMPSSHAETFAHTIPDAVRTQLQATVCIYTDQDGTAIQLSGFCIDENGFIVTTAHDLTLGQQVEVRFNDGRETPGRIIKLDSYRDLCLIQVAQKIEKTFAIRTGRYMPGRGDTLYAVGCPQHDLEEINPGFLDGPPRRVDGLPLWQVQMKIEHGSSGSPVLDSQGRLTAVVKGRYRGTNSIGFLIPFETLLHFLEKY